MKNIMKNIQNTMSTYNYKEEVEKILKEKNITFYYDYFDINDNRRYKISSRYLELIDELEKYLSEAVNEKYSENQKEEFIKLISKIINEEIKKENGKNLISVSNYRTNLKATRMGLFVIVN